MPIHPDPSDRPTIDELAAAVDRARFRLKDKREQYQLADHKLERCLAAYSIRLFSLEGERNAD